ncbi:hypothetical protein D3C75_596450 [compost metagenome]
MLALVLAVVAVDCAAAAVVFAASAAVLALVTFVLVALSCLPVTASVLDVESAPSFKPVMLRTALDLLRTSSTVPVFSPPSLTLPAADTWLTRPLTALAFASAELALLLAVLAVDCAAVAVVFAPSAAVWALVTLELVAYSCLPVTASLLVELRRASFTLTIRRLVPLEPTDTVLVSFATDQLPKATAPVAELFAP